MSDYISRADAIRVISEEYHNRDGNFDGLDAIRELETLPSKGGDAEILNEDFRPKYMQQCPNNGADLISRADAIEAVRGLSVLVDEDEDFSYFEEALKALPSADAVSRKAKCCPIAETCMSIDCPVSSEYIGRPSADAVPQLRQTDTLIIADALRYLAKDTERHLVDRTRADALRQQFLKYGASMCKGGAE